MPGGGTVPGVLNAGGLGMPGRSPLPLAGPLVLDCGSGLSTAAGRPSVGMSRGSNPAGGAAGTGLGAYPPGAPPGRLPPRPAPGGKPGPPGPRLAAGPDSPGGLLLAPPSGLVKPSVRAGGPGGGFTTPLFGPSRPGLPPVFSTAFGASSSTFLDSSRSPSLVG